MFSQPKNAKEITTAVKNGEVNQVANLVTTEPRLVSIVDKVRQCLYYLFMTLAEK